MALHVAIGQHWPHVLPRLSAASLHVPSAVPRLQRASLVGSSRMLASRTSTGARSQGRCSDWGLPRPRFYSTNTPRPHKISSNIKFWPFLLIIALSSGSYILLVNQRKGEPSFSPKTGLSVLSDRLSLGDPSSLTAERQRVRNRWCLC
jgi:hypothetical protein